MSELASESVESTKDELYFLESVTFSVSFLSLLTDLSIWQWPQVENCLFRVPKYRFCNSSEFFAKEYFPTGGSEESEGPIALADITKTDFQNFLKTLYPLYVSFFIFVLSSWCVSVAKYLQNCHSRELNGSLYSSYQPCGNLTRFDCLQYHN